MRARDGVPGGERIVGVEAQPCVAQLATVLAVTQRTVPETRVRPFGED